MSKFLFPILQYGEDGSILGTHLCGKPGGIFSKSTYIGKSLQMNNYVWKYINLQATLNYCFSCESCAYGNEQPILLLLDQCTAWHFSFIALIKKVREAQFLLFLILTAAFSTFQKCRNKRWLDIYGICYSRARRVVGYLQSRLQHAGDHGLP